MCVCKDSVQRKCVCVCVWLRARARARVCHGESVQKDVPNNLNQRNDQNSKNVKTVADLSFCTFQNQTFG